MNQAAFDGASHGDESGGGHERAAEFARRMGEELKGSLPLFDPDGMRQEFFEMFDSLAKLSPKERAPVYKTFCAFLASEREHLLDSTEGLQPLLAMQEAFEQVLPTIIAIDSEFAACIAIDFCNTFESVGLFQRAASILSQYSVASASTPGGQSSVPQNAYITARTVRALLQVDEIEAARETADTYFDATSEDAPIEFRADVRFAKALLAYAERDLPRTEQLCALAKSDLEGLGRAHHRDVLEIEVGKLTALVHFAQGFPLEAERVIKANYHLACERFGKSSVESYAAHEMLFDYYLEIGNTDLAAGVARSLHMRAHEIFPPFSVERTRAFHRKLLSLIRNGEIAEATTDIVRAPALAVHSGPEGMAELNLIQAELDMAHELFPRAESRIRAFLLHEMDAPTSEFTADSIYPLVSIMRCRLGAERFQDVLELGGRIDAWYQETKTEPDRNYFQGLIYAAQAFEDNGRPIRAMALIDRGLELADAELRSFPLLHAELRVMRGRILRFERQDDYEDAIQEFERSHSILTEMKLSATEVYRKTLNNLAELSSAVGDEEAFNRYATEIDMLDFLDQT